MGIDVNRLFLLFMGAVGGAVGTVLVLAPQARDFRLPPYFWILIAMAAFELIAFARATPRDVVTMQARIAGFVLAIALVIVIPVIFGFPARLF